MGEIGAHDLWRESPRALSEGKGHVPGTAAKVEHTSVIPLKYVSKAPRCTPPPVAVGVHRQHVIQEVVPVGYGAEHVADSPRGRLTIRCTRWRRSHYYRFCFRADDIPLKRSATDNAVLLRPE